MSTYEKVLILKNNFIFDQLNYCRIPVFINVLKWPCGIINQLAFLQFIQISCLLFKILVINF